MFALHGPVVSIFPILFLGIFIAHLYDQKRLCEPTMTAFMLPTIWSQFKFNLLLQIFDGLYTYHALTQGIPEANPLVGIAIDEWGALWGLVYWKLLACALLSLIFAVSPLRKALAMRALTLTASVYGCLFVVSLCHLLLHF